MSSGTNMFAVNAQDLLVLCLCFVLHVGYRYRRKRSLPSPPGPTRWPIAGNAFMMPSTYIHVFYKNLGAKLGSKMVYLEVFGNPILIVNDLETARDLLEKCAALYSSRRQIRMLTEVIGFKALFGLMPYADEWRIHRRMLHQHFSETRLLTYSFEINSFIGGLSSSLTYGLPTQRKNDPLVRFAEQGWLVINRSGAPGRYLVNILAPLKYAPGWMPGAGFKKEAKEMRKKLDRLIDEPYEATVNAMVRYTNSAPLLETLPKVYASADKDNTQAIVCGRNFDRHRYDPDFDLQARTIETTAAATMTFILAMVIHPEVQMRAQQEVDSVVGNQRLPEFSDIPHLPYLSAVIKEVLRWNPATPLGVPHMTSGQDVYKGYYIPNNCTVIANAYAMLHDEDVFPDPTEFRPGRFIGEGGHLRQDIPDPEFVATFGFGRRACPGSHLARSMLYITAASILSLFDISSSVDTDGKPIKANPRFAPSSLVSDPLPFPCKIIPRSGKDVKYLMKEYVGAELI
ncbi:hypothetical protein D9756_009655 [Leucocoprinus leucothites]|uniref:Cytochrome P450 n=1 Tax=Leucocoprinus leucothites TaxID=201217 RepID=A0A8H5CV39_9AGAR|nr:hypothetical protein D9756_009655 [Leucoagaricus leucothites]